MRADKSGDGDASSSSDLGDSSENLENDVNKFLLVKEGDLVVDSIGRRHRMKCIQR